MTDLPDATQRLDIVARWHRRHESSAEIAARLAMWLEVVGSLEPAWHDWRLDDGTPLTANASSLEARVIKATQEGDRTKGAEFAGSGPLGMWRFGPAFAGPRGASISLLAEGPTPLPMPLPSHFSVKAGPDAAGRPPAGSLISSVVDAWSPEVVEVYTGAIGSEPSWRRTTEALGRVRSSRSRDIRER